MRSVINAAVVLCIACFLSSIALAQPTGCSLANIKFGLINQSDCELSSDEVIRGLEMYKARANREVFVYTPPRKPNLRPTKIREHYSGGNAYLDAQVRVQNNGTDDAGRFDVVVQAEFVEVDTGTMTVSQPVTLRMLGLAAGDREYTDWLRNNVLILIPSPDPDYNVVLRAIVDPQNRVDESNELDNVLEEFCRIPGLGEGQGRLPDEGQDYC